MSHFRLLLIGVDRIPGRLPLAISIEYVWVEKLGFAGFKQLNVIDARQRRSENFEGSLPVVIDGG